MSGHHESGESLSTIWSRNSVALVGGTAIERRSILDGIEEALSDTYVVGRISHEALEKEGAWGMSIDNDIVLIDGDPESAVPKMVIGETESPDVVAAITPAVSPQKVAQFITDYFTSQAPPVFGVVLAGGKSSRMGVDKAGLRYYGRPQVDIAVELLQERCAEVYISVADDSGNSGGTDSSPASLLPDRFVGFGPSGGILTALHEHPGGAWLVLGCDLPLISGDDLDQLIGSRDVLRPATAFRSPTSDLPEPLAAIFEPKMRYRIHSSFAAGLTCPRKILIRSHTKLVTPERGRAVLNANTQEDRRHVMEIIAGVIT